MTASVDGNGHNSDAGEPRSQISRFRMDSCVVKYSARCKFRGKASFIMSHYMARENALGLSHSLLLIRSRESGCRHKHRRHLFKVLTQSIG